MSHILRKPAFCICENKGADQLHASGPKPQRQIFHEEAHLQTSAVSLGPIISSTVCATRECSTLPAAVIGLGVPAFRCIFTLLDATMIK